MAQIFTSVQLKAESISPTLSRKQGVNECVSYGHTWILTVAWKGFKLQTYGTKINPIAPGFLQSENYFSRKRALAYRFHGLNCCFGGMKTMFMKLPRTYSGFLWCFEQKSDYKGSRDGTVVKALASIQCSPGSIPEPDTISGLSLCWFSSLL